MLPIVSVIIPIYNTEEFLCECMDSILVQTYQNIELLLVDDGSTDGSGALCDSYAATHSTPAHRIVALHKPNGGLADARNYGMQHATGEYLLFLDSDDYYLLDDAIAQLVEKATETDCDVLCFNYTRSQKHTPERTFDAHFSTDTARLITSNVYTSSACLKLMKKEVLTAQGIEFIKGQLSEDILFSGKLLANGNRIAFLNEVIYYYRVRETSITNTLKLKNITDMIGILKALEEAGGVSSAAPTANPESANLLAYTAFQYATLLINMHLCAQKIPTETRAEIYARRYLLQYNPTGIVKIIALCSKCIGVRATSRLMALAFQGKQVLYKLCK